MNKIKAILKNKWFGFIAASILYILWFVVWTESLWMLLGLPIIYDIYISRLMHRYIMSHNERWCQQSKSYKALYEWINAIVFATVVASIVHLYVFQMYVIPTSSMEGTLLVGDYLYVSKLSYGPKMPNTPIAFPFVHNTMPFSTTSKSFSEAVEWGYKRLAGLRGVERDDMVVFNFPAGDTVILENPAVTYYDVLRDYQTQYGEKEGRKRLENEATIVSRPVDKRDNYIKRAVAIAGDSLLIKDGVVIVNGEPQKAIEGIQYLYLVQTVSPISQYTIDKLGISEISGNGSNYSMFISGQTAEKLRKMDSVVSVRRHVNAPNTAVFPQWSEAKWSQDNYGPIWIPQKGVTVTLTTENLPLYRRIIEVYEGHTLAVDGETILIDGNPAQEYTFAMDYYWMMGDNRHNSADSRFWGFVPEDHIVGTPLFICLSLDGNKSFPSNIRWDRIFSSPK